MTEILPTLVYLLSFLASLVCAILLGRSYVRTRTPLLFWSAMCFTLLAVVNLNPHGAESGWLELDLAEIGISTNQAYRVVDLLSGQEFAWQGPRAFISLDPAVMPAHLFYIPRG